nr:MAG TPA: hypothetical protein [Caudoviricetes sp.]DAY97003.1 MAG TPA: hypothetical protein [Caudoviricetes sp.]
MKYIDYSLISYLLYSVCNLFLFLFHFVLPLYDITIILL